MYLLVTAQAGLHGRRLLLVPEGWRVGQRGDTPVGPELRLGEAELTEYRGVLTGHGEEGVLLGRGQAQAGAGQHLLGLSGRHRPRV